MVSIAMATYNGEKYIREQIDSILNQSIKDFELVVCDDNSTDNTWNILSEYAAIDRRIKIYRNNKNIGFKDNFEKAIKACTGDYIALSDQDDVWLENHLETLLANIGDKALVCGDSELIYSDGTPVGMTDSYREAFDNNASVERDYAMTSFFYRSFFRGACMMMRRDFVERALPIPKDALYHDSWFATFSFFEGGAIFLPSSYAPIAYFRQHSDNVSGGRTTRRRKWGAIFGHVIRPTVLPDKIPYAKCILGRAHNLTDSDRLLLTEVITYHTRKQSLWGRICNFFFELRNYQSIYA